MIIIGNFFSKVERIFYSKFISCKWWDFIPSKYLVRSVITTVLLLSAFWRTRSLRSIKLFNTKNSTSDKFFSTLSKLYDFFSKSLPQCNIKIIFQYKNRLSSFFKFKDSIPLHLCSHLIYKFQCSNCNITYYSETERHLKVRAGEHISTSPLTGKRVNNNKNLPLKITAFYQITCVHLRILLS